MKHLILFDSTCPLCRNSVSYLQRIDHEVILGFLPLSGEGARELLQEGHPELLNENTMVLIENKKTEKPRLWIRGRAVMRIFWLLGGKWRLIVWLCFVPFGVDAVYSFVARHRHRFL